MATSKKTEDNVLLSISVTNHKGESVSIKVEKDYKGALDTKTFPYLCTDYDGNLFVRIDDIEEVIGLVKANRLNGVYDYNLSCIFDEDYTRDDEEGEWRAMDDEEFYNIVLDSFKVHGCCYRYITYSGELINDDKKICIVQKDYKMVKGGAENFCSQYNVGTKAFYHKDGSASILKASKINEIVIRHKAGFNSTVNYVMDDGNTISESSVILKDKALEWVNQHG